MKYVKQFGIILTISFVGEMLNYFIPLPIPTSIYGMLILFLCLRIGVIALDSVKKTAYFLIEIMPLMFIPSAVGLITTWNIISSRLIAFIVITVVSTFVVMILTGKITQFELRLRKKKDKKLEND